jgi:hypothetical protein
MPLMDLDIWYEASRWEGWQLEIEMDGNLKLRWMATWDWERWQLEIEKDDKSTFRTITRSNWEGWQLEIERLAASKWHWTNLNSTVRLTECWLENQMEWMSVWEEDWENVGRLLFRTNQLVKMGPRILNRTVNIILWAPIACPVSIETFCADATDFCPCERSLFDSEFFSAFQIPFLVDSEPVSAYQTMSFADYDPSTWSCISRREVEQKIMVHVIAWIHLIVHRQILA